MNHQFHTVSKFLGNCPIRFGTRISALLMYLKSPKIIARSFVPIPDDYVLMTHIVHGRIQKGRPGVWTPLKNHKNKGFLCNTGPDPLRNHKPTKPASACQGKAISMVFCWLADGGPFIAVFGSSIPHQLKKKILSNLDPL